MGGLPCYQKIIHDGNLASIANELISQTQITTALLAAKGYYDSPMLQEFIRLDKTYYDTIKNMCVVLKDMNDKYSKEGNV